MTTINEIADRLEVSVSTVSRALAGKPGVSEKKRQEIVAAAKEMGYVPNVFASNLRSGKTRGLTIITSMTSPEIVRYRNSILFNIGRKAFGSVRVVTITKDDELDDVLRLVIAEGTRAIIFSNVSVEDADRYRPIMAGITIPMAGIDSRLPGIDRINIDRANGTYQAAKMLLLSGCKYPVFYSANCTVDQPDSRVEGIIRAFEELGRRKEDIRLIPIWSSGRKNGMEVAATVLNSMPVDGIFCYDDYMAVGTLRRLHQAGVRVPEEVKVIGFDNIPIAEMLPISLTTVAQPVEELAEAAVQAVLEREQQPTKPFVEEWFGTQLIVRESAPVYEHALREKIFR